MRKAVHARLAFGFLLAALAAGCAGIEHETTVTAPTDARSWVGLWASTGAISLPTPESCGGFRWNVTSQSGNRMTGEFAATCSIGNNTSVGLSGTASGTIDGDLRWEARGSATGLGPLACGFSLTGNGVLQPDGSLKIIYNGETCVGLIAGTETVRRR